jgi:hypothetical protein
MANPMVQIGGLKREKKIEKACRLWNKRLAILEAKRLWKTGAFLLPF